MAKIADKNSEKRKNIKNYKNRQLRQAWTPELTSISESLNYWYGLWLKSKKLDIEAEENIGFIELDLNLYRK